MYVAVLGERWRMSSWCRSGSKGLKMIVRRVWWLSLAGRSKQHQRHVMNGERMEGKRTV